jgi:Peptidase family S41
VKEQSAKNELLFLSTEDLDALEGGASYIPSPITTINGEDPLGVLNSIGFLDSGRDPNARFNDLLFSQASSSFSSGNGGFHDTAIYPGPVTTFGFENGTYTNISAVATVNNDFTGVDSGEAFFNKFCTGPLTSFLSELASAEAGSLTGTPTSPSIVSPTETPISTPTSSPTSSGEPEPTATGYPYPVILHSKMYIGGYFLNGSFSDTAVLTVYTFEPGDDWVEFRTVSETFIAECVQAGKKKLIIDLRGNPGGLPPLAYDIFKRLFPNSGFPYDPTRFRNHEAYALLSQWYSSNFTDTDLAHKGMLGSASYLSPDTGLNYRTLMTGDMHPFESWEDMYGPKWEYNDDGFTSISVFDVRLIYFKSTTILFVL